MATQINTPEASLEAPVTTYVSCERFAPATTYVVLPGYGQFVEDSPAMYAGQEVVRIFKDQIIPVELCDIDEESGKPIVPGLNVMQEKIVRSLAEAKRVCPEKGQIVVVCHSLACPLVAGLSKDQLQGIQRIIFVSPVYANDKSEKLLEEFGSITVPTLEPNGRFFITPEFEHDLNKFEVIHLLRDFYLKYADRISTIVAKDDVMAHNGQLQAFLRTCHRTMMGLDLQEVDANHFYSTPRMQQQLAEAIARVV